MSDGAPPMRRSPYGELAERWSVLLPGGRADDAGTRRRTQGLAFYRSGRVAALRIAPGRLTASVQGARATPYHVEVLVPVLDERAWGDVVRTVAGELRLAAALLAERWPEGLLDLLADRGVAVLGPDLDVDPRCPCGEADRPCAHLVALWEAAADRFEIDPFALLHLRGRGRQRFLADLSGARGVRRAGEDRLPLDALANARPGTTGDPDRSGEELADAWSRAPAPLGDLDVARPEPREVAAAPLRLLGDPPGWRGAANTADTLAPLVEAAAAYAERLGRGADPRPR